MKPRRFPQFGSVLAIILSMLLLYILPVANSSQASDKQIIDYSVETAAIKELKQAYRKASQDWENDQNQRPPKDVAPLSLGSAIRYV